MIYFVQIGEGGPIKIGFSATPEERMLSLRRTMPGKTLRLLVTIPGGLAQEHGLHNYFRFCHLEAELFTPTTELLAFIARLKAMNAARRRKQLLPTIMTLPAPPLLKWRAPTVAEVLPKRLRWRTPVVVEEKLPWRTPKVRERAPPLAVDWSRMNDHPLFAQLEPTP